MSFYTQGVPTVDPDRHQIIRITRDDDIHAGVSDGAGKFRPSATVAVWTLEVSVGGLGGGETWMHPIRLGHWAASAAISRQGGMV